MDIRLPGPAQKLVKEGLGHTDAQLGGKHPRHPMALILNTRQTHGALRDASKLSNRADYECEKDYSRGYCKLRLTSNRLIRYGFAYRIGEDAIILTSLRSNGERGRCGSFCVGRSNIESVVSSGLSRVVARLVREQASAPVPRVLHLPTEKNIRAQIRSTTLQLYPLTPEEQNKAQDVVGRLAREIEDRGDPTDIINELLDTKSPMLKATTTYSPDKIPNKFTTEVQWGGAHRLDEALKAYRQAFKLFQGGLVVFILFNVRFQSNNDIETRKFAGVGILNLHLKESSRALPKR